MGGNIISFDRLLDVRHVTGDALTARAVFRVMGMLRDGAFEAGRILFRVALKTKSVPLRDQVGLVLITVNLVTIEATQVAVVHVALHEIIALHSVLVCRQVGILIENLLFPASVRTSNGPPDADPAESQPVSRNISR